MSSFAVFLIGALLVGYLMFANEAHKKIGGSVFGNNP